MRLPAGSRLGAYEIVSPIGAGGMGEVYRARDTRLDRTVAIKVLNASLALSPELTQRFEREARAVSQLQHPHICTLHDVGRHDGTDYLVMEFLEGETLADRLANGALPIDQVLRIGIDIADALDHAHRAGIVHRDLKPGNVMLTKRGAKLLDFGLAKPTAVGAAGSGSPPLLSAAPTMTGRSPQSPLTASGSILGTLQYMSPEQFQGFDADARSDIFAFGAMLYEMATGQRAFQGKSQIKVASAILEDDPAPLSTFAPAAPRPLDQIVAACLAKDPSDRIQSAHDLKLQLRWIADQPASAAPRSSTSRVVQWLPWGIAAALAIAAIAIAFFAPRAQPTRETRTVVASLSLPENVTYSGSTPFVTLSPDGTRLAFQGQVDGKTAIYVHSMNSMSWQLLTGTEGAGYIFWSPDSRSLGFSSADGKLKRIDVAGGPAQTIAAAPNGRGGSWSADGTIIFAPEANGAIYRVAAAGGPVTAVTKLGNGEAAHRYPVFLPDGRHFLYSTIPAGRIMAGSLDGGEPAPVVDSAFQAEYADGWLLFVNDDKNLMAQRFEPERLRSRGDPTPVAEDIRTIFNPSANRAAFTVAGGGTLAYASGTFANQLVYVDPSGQQTTPSSVPGLPFAGARFSPDGARLALAENSGGGAAGTRLGTRSGWTIWIHDVERDALTRFSPTSGDSSWTAPLWSPDGRQLAFAAMIGNPRKPGIYVKNANGVGAEHLLVETDGVPLDWSRDGQTLVYGAWGSSSRGSGVWTVQLTGAATPALLIADGINGRLSPNGRWLAYASKRSGQPQIYVASFPDRRSEWQVSPGNGGGEYAVWSGDGRRLYYATSAGEIFLADVDVRGDGLQFSVPRRLFSEARVNIGNAPGRFDVSRDGRIALLGIQPRAGAITVAANWDAALKK